MPKVKGWSELPLNARPSRLPLTDWLYRELRSGILEGRLAPSTRLPSTRDFAALYGVSRGTAVQVFERLQSEGYLRSRVGAGTVISDRVTPRTRSLPVADSLPAYIGRARAGYERPTAFAGLHPSGPPRPFRMGDVDLPELPWKLWARLASRRTRAAGTWMLPMDDPRGYKPLRQSIAHHLGSSRGIGCTAEQIIIVSGVQQALDLLARLLLPAKARIWLEDPGYFGARIAFGNAGAQIVPVPVDSEGILVAHGVKTAPAAAGAYVTPAHQFPLGMAMSLGRRMELLKWAAGAGAFVIEDDYDSEYRFAGRPIPALMSLDRRSSVIMVGSFSKLLFPGLRIGYIVAPPALADLVVAFRLQTDFRAVHLDQAVLADFIDGGHLSRHVRRMREIYSSRHAALLEAARKYLAGVLEADNVHCGLYTAAHLKNSMSSGAAERAASAAGVETLALDRYTLSVPDPRGLLLGFASFHETAIREGMRRLARAFR
ncbi:MAG TPA: PLP-dependent aminotransferase family protein [Bryobacteraceae bacterium]|nr:PLP-dependent aminotransferase family protein [Bryobacteraceae bacterium]